MWEASRYGKWCWNKRVTGLDVMVAFLSPDAVDENASATLVAVTVVGGMWDKVVHRVFLPTLLGRGKDFSVGWSDGSLL